MKRESPVRVLHVVLSLEPGGMENGVVNLSNTFAEDRESGIETHVCCLQSRGAFAERLHPEVTVHVLGKTDGFSWHSVRELRRLCGELRPDIVHTHNLGPLIYATLAGRNAAPLILHGEHRALTGDDLRWKRILQRKWFYRRTRSILTVSRELADDLTNHGLPVSDKIVAIVNGVDAERFVPETDRARVRAGLSLPAGPETRIVGHVGRFDPAKRHDLLVGAFDELARDDENLHLLIVGAGGAAAGTVDSLVAASPFRDRIFAVGHQSEPLPYYQSMDLLVLPSEHEGLANAILEAMACGVPALASRACGSGEVIENGVDGMVAGMEDVSGLSRALGEALADAGRLEEMGRCARRKIERDLTVKSMARRYADHYHQLMVA